MRRGGVALGVVLLLVVVGVVLSGMRGCRRNYDDARRWNPRALSATDPFGHAIFDSIMAETLHRGYTVDHTPLYQLNPEDWTAKSVLIVGPQADFDWALDMADAGCKVMVVSAFLYDDTDAAVVGEMWLFDFDDFKVSLQQGATVSLTWCRRGEPQVHYQVAETLVGSEVVSSCPDEDMLACVGDRVVAQRLFRTPRGGELYVVSTPLLLTNYGILDPEVSPYVLRLMSLIADRPVVRLDTSVTYRYSDDEEEEMKSEDDDSEGLHKTSLESFLSQPPLRAALYIIVATLLLLTFFRARRRQRPIPVQTAPVNHTLEFVRIVGNIYYNRADYRYLLYMKYIYFAAELRRRLLIDIYDTAADAQNMALLATKTGLDPEWVQQTVVDARAYNIIDENKVLPLIDRMNKILKAI